MRKGVFLAFLFSFCLIFEVKAETKEDYEKVYSIVQNEYVEKLSLEMFVGEGIKALHKIDPKLKIIQNYETFQFIFADGKQRFYRKPRHKKSPAEWAESVVNIIENATKMSPSLSLKDFEIFDVMNEASFASLDEFSHYYPSLEDEDRNVKIKKYFGSRLIDGILYVRIKTFNKLTFAKIKGAIDDNPDVKGLILDLRGNRGGMFSEALKTADLFLEKGSLITSVQGKDDETPKIYTAEEDDILEGKPIVVIVDGNTASSAEMLTSALKEQSRAKVIGTKTFGKGCVQNLRMISEDKGFALTNAYFYSPQENKIHKKGIEPEVCLSEKPDCGAQNRESVYEDIDKAVELIKHEI